MTARALVVRLGSGDDTPIDLPHRFSHHDLDLISGNRRLDYGIGASLEQLAEWGLAASETAVDLMLLAAGVQAADTRVSRSHDSENNWTRDIALSVPVATPGLWSPTCRSIERMLSFLTGDRWLVVFRPRPQGFNVLAPIPKLTSPPIDIDTVSLFSGGLDSLIGAIDLLAAGHRPLLISHASDGAASSSQDSCHNLLTGAWPESLLRLRARQVFPNAIIEEYDPELTMRGRSFLFFALASLAASSLTRSVVVSVPENGLISLNVPLDPLRVGSHSTRTTHPFYMNAWNELLSAIGLDVTLDNPYRFRTKGEMSGACANADLLRRAIPLTMSCSSPAKGRWHGLGLAHCGYCVPCLIRRAAIAAARYEDDTVYNKVDLWSSPLSTRSAHGRDVRSFQYAAASLAAAPHHADLLIHKSGPLPVSEEERLAWADVYRRGLAEVDDFVADIETAS